MRRIRGFWFFFFFSWLEGVWGLWRKGVEGLSEDGRRDGASPSEALRSPPPLPHPSAYGMADVS